MAPRPRKAAAPTAVPLEDRVADVLARLEKLGSKRVRDDMLNRYGIVAPRSYGVGMATMQKLAKELGRDHALAAALWETGWYEARTVAVFVEDPEQVTAAQMDAWCHDFDNWAICDTACFKLFDRTPHAFRKVSQWSGRKDEFVRRAAFALLASLAAHDADAGDEAFLACFPLIERAAEDDRNFVKKGVSWALRAAGWRNPTLHKEAVVLAQRLVESTSASARWIGRDALRQLAKRGAAAQR